MSTRSSWCLLSGKTEAWWACFVRRITSYHNSSTSRTIKKCHNLKKFYKRGNCGTPRSWATLIFSILEWRLNVEKLLWLTLPTQISLRKLLSFQMVYNYRPCLELTLTIRFICTHLRHTVGLEEIMSFCLDFLQGKMKITTITTLALDEFLELGLIKMKSILA